MLSEAPLERETIAAILCMLEASGIAVRRLGGRKRGRRGGCPTGERPIELPSASAFRR
jgi:hypothetical protein